jgi:Co/Zn/Cd efflux system component
LWEVDAGFVIMTAVLLGKTSDLEALEPAADRLRQRLRERFGIQHATFEWRTSESDVQRCKL